MTVYEIVVVNEYGEEVDGFDKEFETIKDAKEYLNKMVPKYLKNRCEIRKCQIIRVI